MHRCKLKVRITTDWRSYPYLTLAIRVAVNIGRRLAITKGGPRQRMRNEQYLRRAEEELLAERKKQEERERKAIDTARFDAAGRGVVATTVLSTRPSCLDVGIDFGNSLNENAGNGSYWYEPNGFPKNEELSRTAITFWSATQGAASKRPNFPAKSCGFTNPLEDGRLHHEEGTDFAVDQGRS